MHFGLTRVLADTVSTLVVLAAFGAGFRYLAGRAFGRAPGTPRLRLPGPRGTITLSLSRAVARVVVLAARFASGAPLGRRRTDATFLSAGTRALAGVPGWFTTAEPGWWAFWPGWKRAAVRWAAVAAAAGLDTRPLITGAVLGWLALLAGLALAPRFKRWRYARKVIRPVYLQLAQYLGTDPADKPDRWLDIPASFATDQDAVITLAYPATWNPDTARQNHIDELIRRHCGPDLLASFGAFQATWATRRRRRSAPRSRGMTCPRTGSTWPPWPEVLSGSRTCKMRSRTCSSRPGPAAAKPPPRPSRPRTSARTAGWSTSSTPSAAPTSTARPGTTCSPTCPASGCTPTSNR